MTADSLATGLFDETTVEKADCTKRSRCRGGESGGKTRARRS